MDIDIESRNALLGFACAAPAALLIPIGWDFIGVFARVVIFLTGGLCGASVGGAP